MVECLLKEDGESLNTEGNANLLLESSAIPQAGGSASAGRSGGPIVS